MVQQNGSWPGGGFGLFGSGLERALGLGNGSTGPWLTLGLWLVFLDENRRVYFPCCLPELRSIQPELR